MTVRARLLRQTLTIARRDFVAIVFTPTFLIFLLAPLLMLSFGAIGGLGAASLTDGAQSRQRIVAFATPADAPLIAAADARLRRMFSEEGGPPPLILHPAVADPAAAANAMLANGGAVDVVAVLAGPLPTPTIYRTAPTFSARYLAILAGAAERDRRLGDAAGPVQVRFVGVERPPQSRTGRQAAGFGAVFAIFFLTLLLAGQSVGMLAEERNSKVIEVLAAAVPLESVFFGKLIGMFGVAILFIGFWAGLGMTGLAVLPGDVAARLLTLQPATGLPAFAVLFLVYFMLSFLLLGAVFLGIGAQASTMREIQMLSLPITLVQVGMFALASAAARQPGSTVATVAEVFPLSSPFAMAGRAANSPELWPHALALGWQAVWVALFIMAGARLFRRGVLKSGGGRPFWRRRARG